MKWFHSCKVITACKRSLRRLCFYTCLSVHKGVCVAGGHAWWGCAVGGGHLWQGAYMTGGVHGRGAMRGRWGACMAGEHTWQGVCMAGGVCGRGVCVAGVCVWQGGMHGRGGMHATHAPPPSRYYEIWSMSGRYAYWNAFLLIIDFLAYIFRFIHTPELCIGRWFNRETETVMKSQLITKINKQKKTKSVVLHSCWYVLENSFQHI